MKVNVVCKSYNSERILQSLGRELAKSTGWTIGEKFNKRAEINYAFPYLELRNEVVKFIGLFTHREDTVPAKAQIWKNQAKKALLRITWAKMYAEELSSYGPTIRILPPLDRKKFFIKLKRFAETGKQLVGVSGFIYEGGRKGEQLLRAIIKNPIVGKFNWCASGHGWPVSTKYYSFDKLQEYYQNLDLYVCLSLIEGIPYPPLEAMACGVRCIVPKGVGLLDELPNIPDLIRYERGNSESLLKELLKVSKMGEPDRKTLREVTEIFTMENWINEHLTAVSNLKTTCNKIIPISDRGFYIVAYGDNARRYAQKLILSIKKNMSKIPIALVSNRSLNVGEQFIYYPDKDLGARNAKLKVYDLAPQDWKYICYLDADTEIRNDVNFLFKAAEQWDMVISKDVNAFHTVKHLIRRYADEKSLGLQAFKTPDVLALAGGVWCFQRNERTKRFFQAWHQEWFKIGRHDQCALLRAYYKNPLKLLVVGNEWNSILKHFDYRNSAGVIHYNGGHARRWVGPYPQRLDSGISVKLNNIEIKDEELDNIFEMISTKTFCYERGIIRRGKSFYADGRYSRMLMEHDLAFCSSKIKEIPQNQEILRLTI